MQNNRVNTCDFNDFEIYCQGHHSEQFFSRKYITINFRDIFQKINLKLYKF